VTDISRRDMIAATAATLATGRLFAQPAPPRLIVRGDDMGYAHAGNEAIVRCFTHGVMTSAEVIAPAPWFPEAVRMLAAHPTLDVGVHLSLSSEWDLVKWRPLTDCPSLRDADGYFFPMIYPNPSYPRRALAEQAWRIEEVERELRAQIELAKRHVPRLSHWSAHMGCTNLREDVRALTKALGREYGIDGVPEDRGVSRATYVGAHTTSTEKIAAFLRMLDSLESGKTYMMVDHPGLDGPELRAIHHVGYEDVAVDRQGVTDTWTSPAVRERIRRHGIRLISYRDL
jgi:chitin disaccharide deacetylase